MRIGLFGGTYNPIHLGHLRAATEVREAFGLDRIILIPAAQPPHKEFEALAAADERLAMLALAVADDDGFDISDVELLRSGPSYTIDTLAHFRSRLVPDAELFLIMGLDAFVEIDTWKAYRRLLQGVPLIVISRPGAAVHGHGWQRVPEVLSSVSDAEYRFSDAGAAYVAPGRPPIHVLDVSSLDISSTRIRALVQSGRSIRYLVPHRVADYIAAKGLYA